MTSTPENGAMTTAAATSWKPGRYHAAIRYVLLGTLLLLALAAIHLVRQGISSQARVLVDAGQLPTGRWSDRRQLYPLYQDVGLEVIEGAGGRRYLQVRVATPQSATGFALVVNRPLPGRAMLAFRWRSHGHSGPIRLVPVHPTGPGPAPGLEVAIQPPPGEWSQFEVPFDLFSMGPERQPTEIRVLIPPGASLVLDIESVVVHTRPNVWALFFLVGLSFGGVALLAARSWFVETRIPDQAKFLTPRLVGILAALALLEVVLSGESLEFAGLLGISGFYLLVLLDEYSRAGWMQYRPAALRFAIILLPASLYSTNLQSVAGLLLLLGAFVPAILLHDRLAIVLIYLGACLGAILIGFASGALTSVLAVTSVALLAVAGLETLRLAALSQSAEHRLLLSEAAYREVFDSVNEGMIIVSAEKGNILDMNRQATELLSLAPHRTSHLDIRSLVEKDSSGEWRRRIEGEVDQSGFFEVRLADTGRWVEIQSQLSRISGEQRWVIIVRDIQARKQAERDRQELEQQLLQSQKMEGIGRLAGGIAHDFNNLLTVINGRADLGMGLVDATAPTYAEFEEIKQAGNRAAELTNRLLAFSRKQAHQPQPLNLNEVIDETNQILRRLIGENIEMVTLLSPGLELVRADPGQLQQVLLNLAVNARDAMPEGGNLTIETANLSVGDQASGDSDPLRPGRYVKLTVTDVGKGMDPDVLRHIFEPFFTTKKVGEGTGLGLSVVYGIVHQHGGEIFVRSRPNAGSVFTLYFPVAEGSARAADVTKQFARGL